MGDFDASLEEQERGQARRRSPDIGGATARGAAPGPRPPASLLELQRTIGNTATVQFLADSHAAPHLQRAVKKGKTRGGGAYFYSTLDPKRKEYKTLRGAKALDDKLSRAQDEEEGKGDEDLGSSVAPRSTKKRDEKGSLEHEERPRKKKKVEGPSADLEEEQEVEGQEEEQGEEAGPGTLGWSFAGAMLEAGRQLGIRDHVVLSVIIEMTKNDLDEVNRIPGLLNAYLTDPSAIASCMKTATKLAGLFVTQGAVGQGNAARGDGRSMNETGAALCHAITTQGPAGCLCNITFGIHGFVVVAWRDHAELLQSFAGADAPLTLASNFTNPRTFTIQGVCNVLARMAGGNKRGRANAQTDISGDPELEPATVLEDDANSWPNVTFSWIAYPLAPPAVLMQLLANRMAQSITVIPRAKRR